MMNKCILFFIIILFLVSCNKSFSKKSASSPTKSPLLSLDFLENGVIDIQYKISYKKRSLNTSVEISNLPSWLYHDNLKGEIYGMPNSSGVFSNILISASENAETTTFGPFQITVGDDPLFQYQWHIDNDAQSTFSTSVGIDNEDLRSTLTRYNGYTGNGVRIAVSDTGVEIAHEDLVDRVLVGESRNYNLPFPWLGDPTTTSDKPHGTAVAGIIAATQGNNKGGRGVAPGVKFASMNFLEVLSSLLYKVDQIIGSSSSTFDIFNYSYGATQCKINNSNTVDANKTLESLFRSAFVVTRNKKGSIYVKSSGNEFSSIVTTSNTTSCSGGNLNDPFYGNSNFDYTNTLPYLIIAGAFNSSGVKSSYSSPGSNLWISAPGGEFGTASPAILTTDLSTCSKGNSKTTATANDFEDGHAENLNCNYTSTMNGTSSAAPNTTGSIALMLEANPELTWRDVKHILATTARKINPNITVQSHPNNLDLAGHTYQDAWIQNAAGYNFHNYYGFGAIHVDNAVNMAKSYESNWGPFLSTTNPNISSERKSFYDDAGLTFSIPDNDPNGLVLTRGISHNYIIEAVQLRISSSSPDHHTKPDQVGIEVYSPSGTKSTLAYINSKVFESQGFDRSQFLSNAFYGEESAGIWTFKFIDGSPGDTGKISRLEFIVYGHKKPNPLDVTSPLPPSNIIHANTYNSTDTTPSISYTASISPDVIRYEVSIGSAPGKEDIYKWIMKPTGNPFSISQNGLNLEIGKTYYINMRAIDYYENESTMVSSLGWTVTP